jgi:hypothetical protein
MRHKHTRAILLSSILLCAISLSAEPKLTKPTLDAWDTYIKLTETRINEELRKTPVAMQFSNSDLKSGQFKWKQLTTENPPGKEIEIPEGMVHHWVGAILIPGVTLDKLIPWLQNYSQYQDYFTDVERSSLNRPPVGNTYDIFLRLTRSKLGVTAHFNTKHDVVYTRRSATFFTSVSRSSQILQVAKAGSSSESEMPEGDDDGYLWRLNSYWRFFEREDGVVVECETVALSKALGLAYSMVRVITFGAINPVKIAREIARDALNQTLTDMRNGVRGGPKKSTRK